MQSRQESANHDRAWGLDWIRVWAWVPFRSLAAGSRVSCSGCSPERDPPATVDRRSWHRQSPDWREERSHSHRDQPWWGLEHGCGNRALRRARPHMPCLVSTELILRHCNKYTSENRVIFPLATRRFYFCHHSEFRRRMTLKSSLPFYHESVSALKPE